MGEFKCDQCPLIFEYDEVLIAHKDGHRQADEWLYNFYVEKIKPTEIDKPKRKKVSQSLCFLNYRKRILIRMWLYQVNLDTN